MRSGERIEELGNGLSIIQSENHYRFTSDSILLSDFAVVKREEIGADLCCGGGVVAIMVAGRAKPSKLYAVDICPDMCDMASRSVQLNGLNECITVLNAPVQSCGITKNSLDFITVNPPYYRQEQAEGSYSESELAARFETKLTLPELTAAIGKLLKPNGRLYMAHRPSRLAEVIYCLKQCKLEPKTLELVCFSGKAPHLALIEARKSARPDVTVRFRTLNG